MLVRVLHFIPDSDAPYGIVGRLMAARSTGSFLVMVHLTLEVQQRVHGAVQHAHVRRVQPLVHRLEN